MFLMIVPMYDVADIHCVMQHYGERSIFSERSGTDF